MTAFCTTLVMDWISSLLLCIINLLRHTTRYGNISEPALLLANRGSIPQRSAELCGCIVRNNAALFLTHGACKRIFAAEHQWQKHRYPCFLTNPRFLASQRRLFSIDFKDSPTPPPLSASRDMPCLVCDIAKKYIYLAKTQYHCHVSNSSLR